MFDDSAFPEKPTLNEMAVYMLIARFSLTGQRKGWFGKWKEAEKNLMVKNIGRSSYYNALNSLEALGVIENHNGVYTTVHVVDKTVHVVDDTVHVMDKTVHVVDKTVHVVDDIEYNYKNKGIEGDARTHTCDAPASAPEEDLFIVTAAAFALQPEAKPLKSRDETIAQQVYKDYTPEEKQALLQAVRNGYNKKHNFRFTVEDFRDDNPCAEQRMTYSEYYSAKGTTEPVDGWRQVIPGQGEMYYVKP